jgi:hypothetical protein
MQPQQKTIDFSRAEQLDLLRRFEPPRRKARDGGGVSPAVLKSVLRAIDDHGRGRTCYLLLETIAAEVGIRLRQAKRSIEILSTIGVLAHETKRTQAGGKCNHYTIVWSELVVGLQRAEKNRQPSTIPINQSATHGTLVVTNQSAIRGNQSAMWGAQSAMRGTYKRNDLNDITAADENEPTDWGTAAAELKDFGLFTGADLIQGARSAGEAAESFLARARTAIEAAKDPINARKLAHPQKAVAWFLAKGVWPVDGICQGVALALAHSTQRAAKQNVDQVNRLATIIRLGRKQGISDERIKARLRAEFPEELCKSQGW